MGICLYTIYLGGTVRLILPREEEKFPALGGKNPPEYNIRTHMAFFNE